VTGSGFASNESLIVKFQPVGVAANLAQIVSLSGASVTGTLFTQFSVPASAPGAATVWVVDNATNAVVATQTLTITAPAISVSPISGPGTTNIAVTGSGFAANTPVTVTLGITGAVAVATNTVAVVASISGTFTGNVVVPPTAATGNYIVTASDGVRSATAPFTVTAGTAAGSLTLAPFGGNACTLPSGSSAAAVPNQQIAAVLSGFSSGEVVSIVINGAVVTSGAVPGGAGTVNFTLPTGLTSAMTYTVSAIGSTSTNVATGVVFVCGHALSASPASLATGSPVTLSGTGYAAGETVTMTIYPQNTTPVTFDVGAPAPVVAAYTTTAGSTGGFSSVFTPTAFGVFTARSAGQTSGYVNTTVFTVTAAGVSVSPPVYPTQSFQITATSGFTPSQVVTLTPQGGSTVTATILGTGGFVATLVAPANTPVGSLPVTISAGISGTFTVLQPITVPVAVLSANPSSVALGGSTTISGSGYIPNQPVNLALYFAGSNGELVSANPATATVVVTASAAGTISTTFPVTPAVQVIGGAYVVQGTSQASISNTATVSLTVTGLTPGGGSITPPNQPTTIYFAEGYTGRFATNGRADFDESISVLNPDSFAKTVTFTYQIQGSSAPVVTTTVVGPNSDILRSVNTDVGNDKIVSAIVSSDGRIAAERLINRTASSGKLDGDSSLGNTAPGTTWFFAEGYTGASFQEYLTVQNPGATNATVTVTFLPASVPASTTRSISFTVPAMSRWTENIRRDYLPYSNKSVGMIVTSDQPIVSEREEYWGDGAGSGKAGMSSGTGMTNASKQFFFAYGSNPGATAGNAGPGQQANDESYVTVVNPAPAPGSDATVLVSFFDAKGNALGSKSITVSPQTRETVVVNNVIAPVSGPFYTVVSSDQAVFVEHPQYIGGSPNTGAHPGLILSGSPAGLQSVLFPSLNTGAASNSPISVTVFLLNPGTSAITVNGTYFTPSGTTVQVAYSVAAGGLTVVNVNADAGNLATGPLGAQYTTAAGGQFVAAAVANTTDNVSYIGSQGVANQ